MLQTVGSLYNNTRCEYLSTVYSFISLVFRKLRVKTLSVMDPITFKETIAILKS